MSMLPSMRPDFTVPLTVDSDQVWEAIAAGLGQKDVPFVGQVLGDHASIRLPEARRGMLSPYLELEIETEDEYAQGPALHGRFSPQPNVWTGFMALFGVIGMFGLTGVIFGTAKLMRGDGWFWLLSGPVAVALIAFVHGAAFIGQGLSTKDMFDLRDFVQRTVRDVESKNNPSGQSIKD